ncbi:MAG: hypothetical protein ACYSYM_02615 [Planctomycetota bacterium]|jgi:hypothetical protein
MTERRRIIHVDMDAFYPSLKHSCTLQISEVEWNLAYKFKWHF